MFHTSVDVCEAVGKEMVGKGFLAEVALNQIFKKSNRQVWRHLGRV